MRPSCAPPLPPGTHTPCDAASATGAGTATTRPAAGAPAPSVKSIQPAGGGSSSTESVDATTSPGGIAAKRRDAARSVHSTPLTQPSSAAATGSGASACGSVGCAAPPRADEPTCSMRSRAERSGSALSVERPARLASSSATQSSALSVAPPEPARSPGSGTPRTSVSGVAARSSDATALATSSDCAVTTIASHETSAVAVIASQRCVGGEVGGGVGVSGDASWTISRDLP